MFQIKETPWEGGVRAVAAIWSPLIQHRHRVSSQLMYMTDWLPTLYSAAGQNVSNLGEIDGVDMWDALVTGGQSPRTQFVYNIDDVGDVYAAIRRDDWKYLKGNVHKGIADDWYGETGRDVPGMQYDVQAVLRSRAGASFAGYTTRRQVLQKRLKKTTNATLIGDQWRLLRADTVRSLRSEAQLKCDPAQPPLECRPRESPCLFNIREDPCERRNLADQRPDIIAEMEDLLLSHVYADDYNSKCKMSWKNLQVLQNIKTACHTWDLAERRLDNKKIAEQKRVNKRVQPCEMLTCGIATSAEPVARHYRYKSTTSDLSKSPFPRPSPILMRKRTGLNWAANKPQSKLARGKQALIIATGTNYLHNKPAHNPLPAPIHISHEEALWPELVCKQTTFQVGTRKTGPNNINRDE
ncbi:hypothetical protein J6590_034287 [Homalodisca vitripennis]|nr:hypothetical protein J6590_034287 [Homalodisca vitripennis]